MNHEFLTSLQLVIDNWPDVHARGSMRTLCNEAFRLGSESARPQTRYRAGWRFTVRVPSGGSVDELVRLLHWLAESGFEADAVFNERPITARPGMTLEEIGATWGALAKAEASDG